MGSTDDRIKDFLIESCENLDQLDRDLVALEKDPSSRDLLARVFRVIHTIKGTCGFFGFAKLEALTHAAEETLSRLRDGLLSFDPRILSALLSTVDAVRKMLCSIEASRTDGKNEYQELIRLLLTFLDGEKNSPGKAPVAETPEAPECAESAGQQRSSSAEGLPALSESNIRVDVDLLDKLMNLVGELVLTRNQMLQLTQSNRDKSFLSISQRLNLITRQLQEDVMKTRLQRIGALWDRLPRVVRDVAVVCGKSVRLELEGEGTELDKSIIEAIKDPLVHLLRNSIDHGIEDPAARAAMGKAPEGRVRLRAFHENGQVRIEVEDDGAGIDIERVRRKALATGLLSPERAAILSDEEAIDLIFLPGFSTAETVTNVSGRGVGLDVVKTNIEKIAGAVQVESRRGHGTTFSLKIPLTLTIVPALIVTSCGERFAIPLVHLLEVVRLDPSDASHAIETVHGALVYRHRGNLLPIVDLKRKLKLGGMKGGAMNGGSGTAASDGESRNLLALQAEGRQFGLLVDRIHDTEEIVVKPIGKRLQPLSVFAGATVMGDGKAALILDVPGIAQSTGLDQGSLANATVGHAGLPEVPAAGREKLLLLNGSGGTLFAVLVHMVERLEEVSTSRVERIGRRDVLQHRGTILPLVYLDELIYGRRSQIDVPRAGAPSAAEGLLRVVVCRRGGKSAGLVVEGMIDIVEETLVIQPLGARRGVLGSMVIQGRVAEIVNLDEIVRIADDSVAEESEIESLAGVSHV